MVFHVTEYGDVVSSAPRFAPSSRNWTPDTPTLSDAEAETVTAVPRTVAPAAGAVTETVGGVASEPLVTLREKVVVRDRDAAVPVTVIVEVPTGVDAVVVRVRVVVQAGLQPVGENAAVVPAGNPEAANDTGWVGPDTRVALMAFVTEEPRTTDLLPPLERLKSKAAAGVVAGTGADGVDVLPAAS